jgi:lysophospholipase L1-like esterase
MSSERLTLLARIAHRPIPVLLGVAVGFLSCCIAGRISAHQQSYERFVRFHLGISPGTHLYPTFSQVLNLAREQVQPGKVMVVVGGNSVFHGVGQSESGVWTRRLQEQLGDDFVVLNLALRGNDPFEFGGLVAERLAYEGVPVVFVTVALDGNIDLCSEREWEGRYYQYFFWDAWGKGLLPPLEKRDQWANKNTSKNRLIAMNWHENRHRGFVDSVTYASDLWNTVAYRYFCSVWSPIKCDSFWLPHKSLQDSTPSEDLLPETCPGEEEIRNAHKIMQDWIHTRTAEALLRGENDKLMAEMYRQYLPDALKNRTLFVFRMEGTFFRNRLPTAERDQYEALCRRLPQAIDGDDLHVQLVGESYTEKDYLDRSHFSERGGRKLADDLTPTIRSIARDLYGTGKKP